MRLVWSFIQAYLGSATCQGSNTFCPPTLKSCQPTQTITCILQSRVVMSPRCTSDTTTTKNNCGDHRANPDCTYENSWLWRAQGVWAILGWWRQWIRKRSACPLNQDQPACTVPGQVPPWATHRRRRRNSKPVAPEP